MADQNGTTTPAAPAPAPTQPVVPAQPSIPEGHRLVKNDEWERASRYGDVAKGYEPFYKTAKELGFDKPEDLAQFKDFFGGVKKRGWDSGMLNRLVSDQPEDRSQTQTQQAPPLDGNALKAEIRAEIAHESAVGKESDLLDSAAKEFAGDKATEYDIRNIRRALKAEVEDMREVYPKGHPLHERFLQPITKAHLDKVLANFRKEKADWDAKRVTEKADKVRASVPTQTLGNAGGQGKAETKSNHDPLRPGLPSKADIEEAYAARKAARGR